jgi:hypothetical protein
MSERLTDTELKQFLFTSLLLKKSGENLPTNEKDIKGVFIEINENIKTRAYTRSGFSRSQAINLITEEGFKLEQAPKPKSKTKIEDSDETVSSSAVSEDETDSPGTPTLTDSVTSPNKKKTGEKKTGEKKTGEKKTGEKKANKKSKDLVEPKKLDLDEAELDEESILPEDLVV